MTRSARTSVPGRLILGLCALLAVVAFTSGCSSSKKSTGGGSGSTTAAAAGGSSSASTGGSSGNAVAVKNFSFSPKSLNVAVGTKVTWTFDDSTNHNVTASDNSFKSSDMSSGGTYSYTFNKAGTYNYICTIHQYMTGTVIVK